MKQTHITVTHQHAAPPQSHSFVPAYKSDKASRMVAFVSLFIGLFMSSAVSAADCGEPPVTTPLLPSEVNADADNIRQARQDVIDFSNTVDTYLACMDERANKLFTYMTEEQRGRWNDDLADIHEIRRNVQVQMNERIRTYRAKAQSSR